MRPKMVQARQDPKKSRSPSILVIWTPGEWEVLVQALTEQGGIRLSVPLNPKETRKLARGLLRAANEAEGRPTPHLLLDGDEEKEGEVVEFS